MYTGPGERVEVTAVRVLESGAPCVVDNLVGFGAKVQERPRYTDPTSAAATQIAVGELFTLFVTGIHELPLEGAVAAGAVGDLVFIDPSDDSLALDAGATGDLPLGVIVEVDASRTPDVGRVNLNQLAAFMAVPA